MRSTLIVVSLALASVCLCSSAFSQDGLSLFRKMQDALGGADRIAAIRDFEQDVRAESLNGNTGQSIGEVRKRTRWIRPNYLRIDQVGPGSTYVLYCDGTTGWEILPGTRQVVELTGGELEFARRFVESFRLKTWMADRDPRYRITSPSPHVVRISDGDIAHQIDITLDAASSPGEDEFHYARRPGASGPERRGDDRLGDGAGAPLSPSLDGLSRRPPRRGSEGCPERREQRPQADGSVGEAH
jgi:hypothetical protein